MNKHMVSLVVVVVVVVCAGGHAAELPNHLKEDTISKNLFEPPPPPSIFSAVAAASAKNSIALVPPVTGPSAKNLAAPTEVSTAVHGEESNAAIREPSVPENNDSEQRQTSPKLLKHSEKSASISSQTAHLERKPTDNEHSVGSERVEKVTPVKENTVATHAVKGGSSSSFKVAAQMVGVYQHNKR